MYSYTASVFWYLSWPLLIFVVFHVSRWVLKKYTPIIEGQENDTNQESVKDSSE
ncbi:MAG: hypothetical protein K9H84_07310 [Bacteroidales bacterium]|nr:hypothetical protein [Bacteroidales bacterium]